MLSNSGRIKSHFDEFFLISAFKYGLRNTFIFLTIPNLATSLLLLPQVRVGDPSSLLVSLPLSAPQFQVHHKVTQGAQTHNSIGPWPRPGERGGRGGAQFPREKRKRKGSARGGSRRGRGGVSPESPGPEGCFFPSFPSSFFGVEIHKKGRTCCRIKRFREGQTFLSAQIRHDFFSLVPFVICFLFLFCCIITGLAQISLDVTGLV